MNVRIIHQVVVSHSYYLTCQSVPFIFIYSVLRILYMQMQISVAKTILLSSSALSLVLRPLPPHRLRYLQISTSTKTTTVHRRTPNYDRLLSSSTTGVVRQMSVVGGAKFESPSAERNRDPIWQVLEKKIVPKLLQPQHEGPPKILEVAAGAGVHTQYFAKQLLLIYQQQDQPQQPTSSSSPLFLWYPTDIDPLCLSSIRAYVHEDAELRRSRVVQIPTTTLTMQEEQFERMEGDLTRILHGNGDDVGRMNHTIDYVIDSNTHFALDLILNINMIHIAPWSATIGLMTLAGRRLQPNTGMLFLYGPYKVQGTYCESNRYEKYVTIAFSTVCTLC